MSDSRTPAGAAGKKRQSTKSGEKWRAQTGGERRLWVDKDVLTGGASACVRGWELEGKVFTEGADFHTRYVYSV